GERGDSSLLANRSAANDLLDSESFASRSRAARSLRAGDFVDVPRDRRRVAGERFPATALATRAARTVRIERHVTQLARGVMFAAQHLAGDDDSHTDAIRHAH